MERAVNRDRRVRVLPGLALGYDPGTFDLDAEVAQAVADGDILF